MADDTAPPKGKYAVDPVEMGKLLRERDAWGPCPACGRVEWDIEQEYLAIPALMLDDFRVNPTRAWISILRTCGHCGLGQMFGVRRLGIELKGGDDAK